MCILKDKEETEKGGEEEGGFDLCVREQFLLTEAWVVVVCCEVLVLGELACLLAAIVACKRDWQRNECLNKLFNPAQLLGSVRTPVKTYP